jgi:hypothetical protein
MFPSSERDSRHRTKLFAQPCGVKNKLGSQSELLWSDAAPREAAEYSKVIARQAKPGNPQGIHRKA